MNVLTGDRGLLAGLGGLDPAQVGGVGDMSPEQFRAAAHATVDLLADYLAHVEDFAILPAIEPGRRACASTTSDAGNTRPSARRTP